MILARQSADAFSRGDDGWRLLEQLVEKEAWVDPPSLAEALLAASQATQSPSLKEELIEKLTGALSHHERTIKQAFSKLASLPRENFRGLSVAQAEAVLMGWEREFRHAGDAISLLGALKGQAVAAVDPELTEFASLATQWGELLQKRHDEQRLRRESTLRTTQDNDLFSKVCQSNLVQRLRKNISELTGENDEETHSLLEPAVDAFTEYLHI